MVFTHGIVFACNDVNKTWMKVQNSSGGHGCLRLWTIIHEAHTMTENSQLFLTYYELETHWKYYDE